MRALRKLDGQRSCPGEHICTSDRKHGQIAGVKGRIDGRSLKNYCHDKEPTPFNGLLAGCPLYATKPENVPPHLFAAIEAAEELRELKELNLLPSINELTAWEVCCYRVAEGASRKIEAEAMQEATNKSGNQTPMGTLGEGEPDGGAFASWEGLEENQ